MIFLQKPIRVPKPVFVRFVRLKLKAGGPFHGISEMRFDSRRTLVAGPNGSGKTIIARALRNAAFDNAAVETEGDRSLIDKYSGLIFLDCDSASKFQPSDLMSYIPQDGMEDVIKDRRRRLFNTLMRHKIPNIKTHQNLNPDTMAAEEKMCFYYASVLAVRSVVNADIPLVFDRPYVLFGPELRRGAILFLKAQPFQQILLGCENEFVGEEPPHYVL